MSLFTDFIENSPIFKSSAMSRPLRDSMIRTLQGLGLPTPMYTKREPWGYRREGNIYLPIEQDLQILLKAVEMAESKLYHIDDIIVWLHAAPITKTFERRNFFNLKNDRPPFPELRLPVDERINLVYRTASRTTEESVKKASFPGEASQVTSG